MDIKNEILSVDEVYSRSIKSVKWTTLGEICSQTLAPLTTLILARLLSPDDFGIVAIATIAIGFVQIWQNLGLRETLIQRKDRIDEASNIIFWSNITLGFFLYALIYSTSPYIAEFFNAPASSNILRVLCLQVIIVSFFEVHSALLQRTLNFKPFFYTRIGASIIPGIISIYLAFMGFGVWSLVYGTLSGSIIQLILFWKLDPWRPKFKFDFSLAKEMLGFSAWVTLETFLGWLIVWSDSIILGHFMGTYDLGVYRVGFNIVTFIFIFLTNPINPIAYSAFSRLQSNIPELKLAFMKMVQLIAIVSLPAGIGLVLLSHPITLLIFGQKWNGLGYVISVVGLLSSLSFLVSLNPSLFRAVGRPDVNSKLFMAAAIYYIPVYLLFAPYGLQVFCLARLGVSIISILLHLYACNKVFAMPWNYLWKPVKTPLIASIFMGFGVYMFSHLIDPYNLLGLIIAVITGVIFYVSGLYIFDKALFNWGLNLTKQVMK